MESTASVPTQHTPDEIDWADTEPSAEETSPKARRRKAKPEQTETGFERVPPGGREKDLVAEQSVLGGMLLAASAIIDVSNVLSPDDYYRPAHQTIHRAILDLHKRKEPADPITVARELGKLGELERVGGASYLHTLVNSVPTAANAEYYAEGVREQAVLRRLVEAGTRIVGMGYAGEGEIDEIAAAAAAEIAAVVETRGREDDFVLPRDTVGTTLDNIEAAGTREGITGVPTGFADLDALTQGWQPGQVIIVAGRPGHGKSTVAMDFARACTMPRNSADQLIEGAGLPAAFITLEMSVDELNMRALSAEGKVGLHHLRAGTLDDAAWQRLAVAAPRYSEAPLYINESAQSLPEIQAKCRRLKHRVPTLSLIIIDYVQLITAGTKRRGDDNRQQEVSDISRSIKLLAKELGIPIIILAQLNRGPEMRTDKTPMVADLRESGSLEQDADIIILLHRPDAYEKEHPRAGEVDLIVGKHRNGPTATITLAAQLHYSRFVDMTRDVA
ncbi:replicative DNA helicase [Kitasatospora sp. NPDC051170]|uniref:replicative DNA helicase n=1 Tax=Kitasatospora sp. NPDC051170 TaxID=3364056 RepID=UPI0037B81606